MIQIDIGEFTIHRFIVDPRSSINIMALLVFEQLGLRDLRPTTWVCQGYDKSCKMPLGQMLIPITLDEKTVTVEVEILNQELDYNILLGRTWIDEMEAVVSSLFG